MKDQERCRFCGQLLPERYLLKYDNMPKSAQFFPTENEISDEQGVDIVLKQCIYCGLVQATGKPVSYYRDVIRATGVSQEMRVFREKQYRDWVEEFDLADKKVIEIGCGAGEYMQFMETTSAGTYGLEHFREAADRGRARGHRILDGFVENSAYVIPLAPYDGFYIMNFLEHIPQPNEFLRGIANNLSDEAVGIVEVPNFDMMLKKSLYSEFIQDHLSYYTEDTLKMVLESNGFLTLECKSIWHNYIISAKVRKRSEMPVHGFTQKYQSLKRQMADFLAEQHRKGKKVAVWGAGHQALANLSLLDMADHIVYVIDSAKFKQNKYTPATHIPIVAPERLKNREVQTVIIMAAGYSQEVKQIMQREYPQIECVIMTEDGLEEDYR